MNTPKLTYAINANNEWVHVDSVPNGNKCGCFCPYCHKPLWAKHDGSVMQHHFAHAKDENCTVSHESALHILAKDIIKEKKAVMTPAYYPKRYTEQYEQTHENAEEYLYWEDYYFDFDELRTNQERDRFDPYWRLRFMNPRQLSFSEVIVEERDSANELQADCIGKGGDGTLYYIEIFVTHKVDKHKERKIQEGNINCLEIKIPKDFPLDRNKLTDYILNRTEGRKWIYYPYAESTIKNQIERAQRNDIIEQRKLCGRKEIPARLCENCEECLNQMDGFFREFLDEYKGRLSDWAYEVFTMTPKEIVNSNIVVRQNYHRESYVVIRNKAHLIYADSDKRKCAKTYRFFLELKDVCEEILSMASNHKDCPYYIATRQYGRKEYIFCKVRSKVIE